MAELKALDIVPELAKSWESSPDAKKWTFKLHQGMDWEKGIGTGGFILQEWELGDGRSHGSGALVV